MSVVSKPYIYEMSEESPASRSIRTKLKSEEDSYALSQRCIIQIPNTRNAVLNCSNTWVDLDISYSGLTGDGTSPLTGITLSSIGAYSVISEIIVEQGTNVIQHTRNHQEIMALLLLTNTDASSALPLSISAGTGPLNTSRSRVGQLQTVTGASPNGVIAKSTYSIPLIGILSSIKKLPLFQLNSPISVTLVFTDRITKILSSNLGSTVSRLTDGQATITASINADILLLSDRAIQDIMNASNIGNSGIMSWSDSAIELVKTNVSVDEQNSANENIKVQIQGGLKPKRLLSCCVFGTNIPNGNCDAYQTYNYGSGTAQIRLGNQLHPPRPYKGLGQLTQSVLSVVQQNSLPLQSNMLSTTYNTLSQRQPGPGVAEATNLIKNGVVFGLSFKSWYDSREGIDSSQQQLETMISLKTSSSPATLSMTSNFVKRYGTIISVAEDGQMTVAY